jgi:hypothetical protein
MKTVISASRRTDIPAFYLDWFIKRIEQGYIEINNPYYPKQVRRISLLPQDVEWIVFWSRNYQHFLSRRDSLKNFNLYFNFTILPKSDLEKSSIRVSTAIEQIKQISSLYGGERINWRYDPLVYWQEDGQIYTNHNLDVFDYICKKVSKNGVKRCFISFANPYKKFIDRIRIKFPARALIEHNSAKKSSILNNMEEIASAYNIQIYSCSNDELLKNRNIKKGSCINGKLLNSFSGKKIVSEAKSPSRTDCGCTKSIDIGSYINHPCHFGCIYCYANPIWK